MSGVHHLSMRVPWRDRPWDRFVCDDPLGNSSCTLLANIGPKRDDAFEVDNAGSGIDTLEQERLPCLSERGTFMSPAGYTVTKKHPYATNRALKGHLHPTKVTLPGYAFEAVPFRWLNRTMLTDDIGLERVAGYDGAAEAAVDEVLGYDQIAWVMDGDNQRAVLTSFFESVVPHDSLVLIYLKHSPLQEERTDRLLVGAARVARVIAPPTWNQSGEPPFTSLMWETVVEHTLRPEMDDGILLPYQQLIPLIDAGVDVGDALAWAPEGRDVEFSYVTEHLSDDAAIEALVSLQRAAQSMRALGVEVPDQSLEWADGEIQRLWRARGPVPGLSAVLAYLGVDRPVAATRAVRAGIPEAPGAPGDPWPLLDRVLADPAAMLPELAVHFPRPVCRIWSRLPAEHRAVLRMLSGFDVSAEAVRMLMNDEIEEPLAPEDLLDNPYLAVNCTHGMVDRVPFTAVDRALYPPPYVPWTPVVPPEVALDGPLDRRRIEALLAEVIERRCAQGDTVVPVSEAVDAANAEPSGQPVTLSPQTLVGLDLDHEAILESPDWSPLYSVALREGAHGYKLTRFEKTSRIIRDRLDTQRGHDPLGALPDARQLLDAALDRDGDVASPVDGADADLEKRAREEKAAGLSALHDAPLSVLIGSAGTGKTTLLKALVDSPGVAAGGVLLLAPTGKAKVQLESKVGHSARTLASFLVPSGRYEAETGRYHVRDGARRQGFGLVVIDEASMLTEEMLAATLDALAGVRRLVLVGDPRQLPPIGAGRPFVDLVANLRPDTTDSWVRVGPGYVELQIPRRQLPAGSVDERRHDLELAVWFGDGGRGAADDAIWADLAEQPNRPTLRYEPWRERGPVEVLAAVMREELPLDARDDPERAFALTYGATENGEYLNWEPGAGRSVESWQILSPTRSRAFGTVELNRHVKRTYRANDTAFAKVWRRANIASPVGPEQIVRGDKVMQTVNQRRRAWPSNEDGYVANGEIGVGVGRITPASRRSKRSLWFNVEFSSQLGSQYGYRPSSREDPPLELAWAVTVHKSQGSEFGTTFVVLPARAAISRELMYTALTRQRDRVVILHEGTLTDLRELAAPWRSETARRLTDLFTPPDPISIELRGQARRYDRTRLHVAANGTPMASKNEVIIASILDELAPGQWEYEKLLRGSDGREVLPDFTITTSAGTTVLWEHAGMLDLPEYARKWELKKQWYADNGVLPHDRGGGENGVLMWTDDLSGVDAQAWRAFACEVLGVSGPRRAAGDGRRRRTKLAPR